MMDYTRLFDILDYQASKFPQADAICGKRDGVWQKYSTAQLIDESNRLSLGLLGLGAVPGDKVAIISANRPEWNIADQAIQQLGLINVPIYPTISQEDFKYIFADAGIKYAFVSDQAMYDKVKLYAAGVESLQEIIAFDGATGSCSYDSILAPADSDISVLQAYRDAVLPSQLATIIYTSGTTGNPKGVMLSHNNVVSNVKAVKPILPIDETSTVLSFLPLCHIYERVLSYIYMSNGVSIYYAESLDTIAANLIEVRPHIFTTVPRLIEKVYMRFEAAAADLTGIKKTLYLSALAFAIDFDPDKNYGLWDSLCYKVYDRLIYAKWRERMGGRLVGICSGAAKLNAKLARVFMAAGIPISEGYGQTETSPVIAVNPFQKEYIKFGTVGNVINGVKIKFEHREGMADGEGEILCQGPNVMMGYYNKPEATAEVIKDGWLYTGDVGMLIPYKGKEYLQITDRVKEIFKTSGGKYIVPQHLESKMKEIPYIEQMLIIGENRNYVSALIVPNYISLGNWCKQHDIAANTPAQMAQSKEVNALLQAEIDIQNKHFGQWETIKRFILLPNEWTVDGGELTPTMKVKRKHILEKYHTEIERLYSGT
jgi:long-chain acyl-CoA synthetase